MIAANIAPASVAVSSNIIVNIVGSMGVIGDCCCCCCCCCCHLMARHGLISNVGLGDEGQG